MLAAARLYVGNDTSLLNIAAPAAVLPLGFLRKPVRWTILPDRGDPVPDGRFGMADGIATIQPDRLYGG